jgi:hypothetical protein
MGDGVSDAVSEVIEPFFSIIVWLNHDIAHNGVPMEMDRG